MNQPSTQNVLDFSLEHFGPASEPDLYTAFSKATESELERFLEKYRAFASSESAAPPDLSPSTLRPYLPYMDKPNWAVGGLQLDFDTLEDEDAEWKIADAIKHRLLYCHSIALDDPLGHLLALTTAQIRLNQGDEGRRALLRFVNLSLHLAPLVRSGVVCFLPNLSYSKNSQERFRNREKLERALKQSETYDPTELIAAAPESVQLSWKEGGADKALLAEVAISVASSRIASGLEAVLHDPDSVSLYLPFRSDVELLQRDTRLTKEITSADFSDRDSWLLSQLIDLDLPGLAELNPDELVEIRTGDEFSQWRQALSNALLAANSLPSTLRNRKEEIERTVREQLTDSQKRLEGELDKSPVLTGLKKGRTSIVIGLVGLTVSALLDPTKITTATIAGLLATSTAATAIEAIQAARPSSRQKAALAHYVAALQ